MSVTQLTYVESVVGLLALVATLAITFAYVKRQTEINAKEIARLSKLVEEHQMIATARTEEMRNMHKEIDRIFKIQTEQDKSFVEIKTTLAQIETNLEYIKASILELKQ
jgi:septal ring factor EnvC (AmiA/AmiB activator)